MLISGFQAEEEAVLGVAGEAGEAGLLEGHDGVHLGGDVAAQHERALRGVEAEFARAGDAAEGNPVLAVEGERTGDDPVAEVGDLEGLEEEADDLRRGFLADDVEVKGRAEFEVGGVGRIRAGLMTGGPGDGPGEDGG